MFDDPFSTAERPWFLVQLKPGGLDRAARNLRSQGLGTFMPRRLSALRHGRRLREGLVPLFPGYLFTSFDPESFAWRAIASTPGVVRLVMRDPTQPARVPAGLIGDLRAACDPYGLMLPPDDLAPGDVVRISGGPFCGFTAKVAALGERDRVTLLLDMMGRAVSVSAPRRALARS